MNVRKQPFKVQETPFNLLPVMSVMFLLIPALLLAMEVIDARAINVTSPKFCVAATGDPEPPPQREPLSFKVRVLEDGFELSYRGADPGRDGPDLPRVEGKLDTAGLESIAAQLKRAYPHEVRVDVTAESTVPYRELVETIDAVRGAECSNPDQDQGGCLFPQPIVSA